MPSSKTKNKELVTTPKSRIIPQYFTREEIHQILSSDLKQKKPIIYFLIDFFWRTGVRVSEATAIVVDDIDFKDYTIRIRSLRRRNTHVRFIPFTADFANEIATVIRRRQLTLSDKLFPISRKTAYNWVVSACRNANFIDDRAHPQTLRHSFAVNLLSQGMPLTFIQECLGHQDLAETLVYTWIVNLNPRKLFNSLQF